MRKKSLKEANEGLFQWNESAFVFYFHFSLESILKIYFVTGLYFDFLFPFFPGQKKFSLSQLSDPIDVRTGNELENLNSINGSEARQALTAVDNLLIMVKLNRSLLYAKANGTVNHPTINKSHEAVVIQC